MVVSSLYDNPNRNSTVIIDDESELLGTEPNVQEEHIELALENAEIIYTSELQNMRKYTV